MDTHSTRREVFDSQSSWYGTHVLPCSRALCRQVRSLHCIARTDHNLSSSVAQPASENCAPSWQILTSIDSACCWTFAVCNFPWHWLAVDCLSLCSSASCALFPHPISGSLDKHTRKRRQSSRWKGRRAWHHSPSKWCSELLSTSAMRRPTTHFHLCSIGYLMYKWMCCHRHTSRFRQRKLWTRGSLSSPDASLGHSQLSRCAARKALCTAEVLWFHRKQQARLIATECSLWSTASKNRTARSWCTGR